MAALTDADIDRAIAGDPDAAPELGAWLWENAELLSAAAAADKIPVTLRIDRDVAHCFRELGPGYQSRMNAVLRAYANAQHVEKDQTGQRPRNESKSGTRPRR